MDNTVILLFDQIGVNIPKIIGWSCYPESMLIDMAFDAIKGE